MWLLYLLAVPLTLAREFSVSGFSSGAFMSAQMHFAYSRDVLSAAVLGGGPYYCTTGSYEKTLDCTITPQNIPMQAIQDFIAIQEKAGTIDPTSYLKNSPVFIFHGLKDSVVNQEVGKVGYEIYKNYVDNDKMIAMFDMMAEHTWPSDYYGGDCLEKGIQNCNYDASEKILTLAFGELKPRVDMIPSNMKSFSQADYVSSISAAGLAQKGYIYVPDNCQEDNTACKVHISFHGCSMNYDFLGDYFINNTGLNRWAESNDIIIIYPQTSKDGPSSAGEGGCWDFWGYTGEDFALKSGIQMKAAYDMTQNPPTDYEDDTKSTSSSIFGLFLFI